MPVGGDDISRTLLLTLFNSSETGEHAFPFKRDAEVGSERRFDWSNPQHKHFLDVLKQNMCEFAPASAEVSICYSAMRFSPSSPALVYTGFLLSCLFETIL